MDKQKKRRNSQEQSELKVHPNQLTNLDEHSSFTDKKRKEEEVKNSTIGGF